MSGSLRIVLILISIGTCVYISRKLKKAQVNTYDTIFWFLIAGIFILFSVFPQIVDQSAKLIGIYSSENFVFLVIIFILLMKVFFMNIKMSQLEQKMLDLIETLAIREKFVEEQKKEVTTKSNEELLRKIKNTN